MLTTMNNNTASNSFEVLDLRLKLVKKEHENEVLKSELESETFLHKYYRKLYLNTLVSEIEGC